MAFSTILSTTHIQRAGLLFLSGVTSYYITKLQYKQYKSYKSHELNNMYIYTIINYQPPIIVNHPFIPRS